MASWKSKTTCIPCAGAKESSDGEVFPSLHIAALTPQPSQQEVRKCPQPETHRCVGGTVTGVEMKYHTAHCSSLVVPF